MAAGHNGPPSSFATDEAGVCRFEVGPTDHLSGVRSLVCRIERPDGRTDTVMATRDSGTGDLTGEITLADVALPQTRLWVKIEPLDFDIRGQPVRLIEWRQEPAPLFRRGDRVAIWMNESSVPVTIALQGGRGDTLQFSDPFVWDPDTTPIRDAVDGGRKATLSETVVLQTGFTLRGRLDDGATRPVFGTVDVRIGHPGKMMYQLARSAELKQDGSFEIPNVPHGAYVELAAVTPDRVSSTLGREEHDQLLDTLGTPKSDVGMHQVVRHAAVVLPEDTQETVILRTSEPATLVVTVIDFAGRPVPDAEVAVQPRIYSFAAGHNNFIVRRDATAESVHEAAFTAVTDELGVATITGLTAGTVQDPRITPLSDNPAGLSFGKPNGVPMPSLLEGKTSRVTWTVRNVPGRGVLKSATPK